MRRHLVIGPRAQIPADEDDHRRHALCLQILVNAVQVWNARYISSTNPIESMIGIVRSMSRNVKRWQNGDVCLRWTAAGMLEAELQFRKIIGYTHLPPSPSP